MLHAFIAFVALLAGGVAAVTGFGIGSLLTPVLALLHTRFSSPALGVVFGIVVAIAGISELTGWMRRVRWGRRLAWAAGALSGALGGMVGNQGGIRTAALLGFDVPRTSFVATATAIGLFVDAARLPVYLTTVSCARSTPVKAPALCSVRCGSPSFIAGRVGSN